MVTAMVGHKGYCHDAGCTKEHYGQAESHDHEHGHGESHNHSHGDKLGSHHDPGVNSFSLAMESEILPHRLSEWMKSLGSWPAERGRIFRIKAILAVKGYPFKHVFHAVMDASDEDDAGPWEEGEKKITKIVFIGKGLDQALLRSTFESIFE